MTKITNSTILSAFRKQMGLDKDATTAFAEAFQSVFEEALLNDKSVKINGLGTFKLVTVEARKSVNVNTGKEIQIAEHYKLTFTPDAILRDKINEPLAHLETIELDDDVALSVDNATVEKNHETNDNSIDALKVAITEEPIDEPLQKLVEQAMELKDILADIQSLGGGEQEIEEILPVESPIAEVSSSEVVQINTEKESPIETQEELQETSQEGTQEATKTQVVVELPKPSTEESKVPISEDDTTATTAVSARDIVAEINSEDTIPKRKMSWGWISLSVVLFLSIVALLFYQNRNFFIAESEQEPIITENITNTESDIESVNQSEEKLLGIEQNFVSEVIDTIDTIVEIAIVEETILPQIDTTSSIYNAQFPDLFNRTREYTEYIDAVTLNEGSRLTYISLKQYGHKDFWVYIYEANRDVISNPNSIRIGTKLRIPKLDPELIDVNNQQCIDYARYLHDVYVKKQIR